MKKFARIMCLVLALMMVTVFASAEELGTIYRQHFGADLTELPITTEDVTIDVWRGFSSTIMDTLADCEVFKKMEEVTGVKINWVYPPVGSETDNFNLRVASNDLPHMFSTPPAYAGGIETAVEDGVYLDYAPYFEKGFTPSMRPIPKSAAMPSRIPAP